MLEFTIENWSTHPCVRDRPATEQDIRDNRAVFYVPDATTDDVVPFGCPVPAILTTQNIKIVSVLILQAQRSPDGGKYIVGAVDQNGQQYVATSDEVEILDGPTPEWTAKLEAPQ